MIYGMDYLGGAKYPDVVLKAHPRGWAAGFFAREFGDVYPLVQKLANSGKCPLIRIQLVWDGTHKYGDRLLPNAIKEARRYEKLAGHSHIQLSPFCEHNHAAPDKYLDAVRAVAPSCEIINTPWKGAWSKRYKNETHTPAKSSAAHNFSYDGIDVFTLPPSAIARPSEILFLWTPALNGKRFLEDKTPIAQRTAWPTRETINRLRRLIG